LVGVLAGDLPFGVLGDLSFPILLGKYFEPGVNSKRKALSVIVITSACPRGCESSTTVSFTLIGWDSLRLLMKACKQSKLPQC